MNTLRAVPADAIVRLHVTGGRYPFTVALARPPMAATPEAIVNVDSVCAALTHDVGVSTPSRQGRELIAATMADGGGCLLSFVRLADAMACRQRIEAGDV